VFIVGVAAGGAAAAADGHALVVGMRIMELDGTRLEKAKKDKVTGIMKAATDTLLVKAKYDPEGYVSQRQLLFGPFLPTLISCAAPPLLLSASKAPWNYRFCRG